MPAGADRSPDAEDAPSEEQAETDSAENEEEGPASPDIDVGEPEHERIAGEAADDTDTFLTVMSHFYRGAVSRSMKWRDRTDRTVHWSVIVVASLLTWSFSSPDRPHVLLLLGMLVLGLFLWIEARRYLFFDVWRSQVRVLEENVFANALDPKGIEEDEWRRLLSEDLRRPAFKITMAEALARRLRRVYLALMGILLAAWVVRLFMLSPEVGDVPAVAGVGPVPGWLMLATVTAAYAGLVGLAAWPRTREAKGHIRDKEEAVDLSKEP